MKTKRGLTRRSEGTEEPGDTDCLPADVGDQGTDRAIRKAGLHLLLPFVEMLLQ